MKSPPLITILLGVVSGRTISETVTWIVDEYLSSVVETLRCAVPGFCVSMMASFAAESTTIAAMSGLSGSFSPMSSKFCAALGYVPILSVTDSFWSVMMELSLLPVDGSSNHMLFNSPVTFTMNSDEAEVDLSVALMTVRPVMSLPFAPMPSVLSSRDMLDPVFVISWNTSWS